MQFMPTVGKADMVVDLQFGSTGKGLIAGYLAMQQEYDVVISANMPNAGHTYIGTNGDKYIHHCLPNGLVSPRIKHVMVGPGSVYRVGQLMREYEWAQEMGHRFILNIHEDSVPLTDEMVTREYENMGDENRIGSTRQGSAEAMVAKVRRLPGITAKTMLQGTIFERFLTTSAEWMAILRNATRVLLEASQGYSLGLNSGFYPYCTSRDTSPSRFLSDMAVPVKMLRKVIGTARCHPIRVGGTSGPCYPDQKELTWAELGQEPELTTTTQRIRRVFSFSKIQIAEAAFYCCPDEIFLNFCNYDPSLASRIEDSLDTDHYVRYTGWGPTVDDVKDRLNQEDDAA